MRNWRAWVVVVVGAVLIVLVGVPGAGPSSARAPARRRGFTPPPAAFRVRGRVLGEVRPAAVPLPEPLDPISLLPPHLGYGINVRLEDNVDPLFAPLGLEWIKLWEEYEGDPPSERLPYQVLFSIERNGMATDLDEWGDRVEAIAEAGLGRVEAYEIGNEPNVDRFWGWAAPDPGQYVQVLQVAYERIKAIDPAAIVVSAGLAPVGRIEGTCDGWGGNNCSAMDEREYARQMLLLGAGDYFDAFGYHPYGFAYEPEVAADLVDNGFAFRGTEVMHHLLGQHDLGHKPVWATEFNWLRDWTEDGGMPSRCQDEYGAVFSWMEVTGVEQANYITRAFQYADENWPWMGAMFVWNLDWHDYHTWDCEAAHYFSVRKDDGTARGASTLAYEALQLMQKRPGYFGPRLSVEPMTLSFAADVAEPGVFTATISPWNAGYRVLTWTATVSAGLGMTPTLTITTGRQGGSLTVTVNSTGYPTGIFTGSIIVSATTTDVVDTPQTVPVTLTVEQLVPRLAVEPPTMGFLADLREPRVFTGVVVPTNTGYHVLTWTASIAAGMYPTRTGTVGRQVTPTLVITTARQGTPLTITLDSTGYTTGTFIGLVSITAVPTSVLDSPQFVSVTLHIVPAMHRAYLPLTLRSTSQGGSVIVPIPRTPRQVQKIVGLH
jgi:hypothetical protein